MWRTKWQSHQFAPGMVQALVFTWTITHDFVPLLSYIFKFQFASQECLHCKWLKCYSNWFKKEGERIYWFMKPKIQRQIWASGIAGFRHSNTVTKNLALSLSSLFSPFSVSPSDGVRITFHSEKSQQTKTFSFLTALRKAPDWHFSVYIGFGDLIFFGCVAAARGCDTLASFMLSFGTRGEVSFSHIPHLKV